MIELAIETELTSQMSRIERLIELRQHGADGSIDQIAINAVACFGDIAATIRRLSREDIFWLPDDTCISVLNGHVSIGNGNPGSDWLWHEDGFTVYNRKPVPDILLTAARGRPARTLFDHPFLSDDIIIVEATADIDEYGKWTVVATLEQPKLLFSSITGRVWQQNGPETDVGEDKQGIDPQPRSHQTESPP